jgi:hypothetical protein
MEKQADAPKVEFVDSAHAPEVFASEACGFFVSDGVIHITFASARVNHSANPGAVRRVVIGRLAMPIRGAQGLALGLYDFLKKQGLDPMPQTASKEKSH